jgi:hypothetical protein
LLGVLQNNAGNESLRNGDTAAARRSFEEAERAFTEIGASLGPLTVNFGWVHREEGEPEAARGWFARAMRQSRRQGEHVEAGYAALGLACLAGDGGAFDEAALLHGIAQGFFDLVGEPVQLPELTYQEKSVAEVKHALGPAFEHQYTAGRAMPLEDALETLAGMSRSVG